MLVPDSVQELTGRVCESQQACTMDSVTTSRCLDIQNENLTKATCETDLALRQECSARREQWREAPCIASPGEMEDMLR